jgi:5-methylcytosine-specific restriction protein A
MGGGWDPTRENTAEWKRTRTRVLARDKGICYVCGHPNADQVDHKTPLAEGGTDDDDNLGAIHGIPCHRDKTLAEAARGRARHTRRRPPRKHPSAR